MSNQLRLYNTLTRRVEPFHSIVPGQVRMFVCGPTIQDYIHLGHARTYLFYDMLARHLAFLGNTVSFVINITDVDEGIVKGAKAQKTPIEEFTSKYEKAFIEDMGRLGISSVSSFDRVSDHLPEMIVQVNGLLEKGNGYRVGGSVYFDIDSFQQFGQLSHQDREQISMRPLEIDRAKRNQADFSLWRAGGEDEQKWESPWGRGTPGWHVQDTAVSQLHFGMHYDIHGGARELIYPHHEAQIAQMEALSKERPFVRYWIHSGLLTQKKEKMAKSRGNAPRARDLLNDYGVGGLRLYLLSMQHRKDSEFDEKRLGDSVKDYEGLRDDAERIGKKADGRTRPDSLTDKFISKLNNDMQTAEAVRYLFRVSHESAKAGGREDSAGVTHLLKCAGTVLGIDLL